jgi:hypothetical protein
MFSTPNVQTGPGPIQPFTAWIKSQVELDLSSPYTPYWGRHKQLYLYLCGNRNLGAYTTIAELTDRSGTENSAR